MKIRKLLIYSVIALFTIAGGYFFVSSGKIKPLTINKFQDKLEIVEVATSTPMPQPSEKALKIASFAWARMNDKQKKEMIKTYGNEASLSSEIIRQFALGMDQDSALMAQNEAKMQKIMTQENRPVYYEQVSTSKGVDTSALQNQINDQKRVLEQQIDDQKRELENLQFDMRMNCIQNGGSPVGNTCL